MNNRSALSSLAATSQRLGLWLVLLAALGILIPGHPWTALLTLWCIGLTLLTLSYLILKPRVIAPLLPGLATIALAFNLPSISTKFPHLPPLTALATAVLVWGSVLMISTAILLYVSFRPTNNKKHG